MMTVPPPSSAPTTPAVEPATPSVPLDLKYEDGQWRPDFREGRKVYNQEFLLKLKECALAMRFPAHLVKSQTSLAVLKSTPTSKSKVQAMPSSGGGGGGGGGGAAPFDFTPSYAKVPGGSQGGGMFIMPQPRVSTIDLPCITSNHRRIIHRHCTIIEK
jgi:hypothetical protein